MKRVPVMEPAFRMVGKKAAVGFRFYTNVISQSSRTVAAGVFTAGMALIGFGFMIYLLPRLFATLAAIVISAAGAGFAITGVRIFLTQRRLDRMDSADSSAYRRNVRIRIDEQ